LDSRRRWVLAALVALVLCAPASAVTVRTIPVGTDPLRAVVLGHSVWVSREEGGTRLLQRVDIAMNRAVGAAIPAGEANPYLSSVTCCYAAHPLAAAYGSLWTTDWRTNEVVRVDPERGVVARVPVGGQLVDVAAGPLGLWAAIACLPPPAGSTLPCGGRQLVRIDPGTNTTAERIGFDPGLHSMPLELAVGRARFWIAAPSSGRRLLEIDLAGAISGVPAGAWALSPRHGALWTVSRYGCEVWRIPAVGAPLELEGALDQLSRGPVPPGFCYKRGLTQAGDGTLWIVGFRDRARTGLLVHLDPRRNRPLGPPLRLGHDPAAITAGAGAIWVVNRADGTLSRIDP
jgi:streptogramin lyase